MPKLLVYYCDINPRSFFLVVCFFDLFSYVVLPFASHNTVKASTGADTTVPFGLFSLLAIIFIIASLVVHFTQRTVTHCVQKTYAVMRAISALLLILLLILLFFLLMFSGSPGSTILLILLLAAILAFPVAMEVSWSLHLYSITFGKQPLAEEKLDAY